MLGTRHSMIWEHSHLSCPCFSGDKDWASDNEATVWSVPTSQTDPVPGQHCPHHCENILLFLLAAPAYATSTYLSLLGFNFCYDAHMSRKATQAREGFLVCFFFFFQLIVYTMSWREVGQGTQGKTLEVGIGTEDMVEHCFLAYFPWLT